MLMASPSTHSLIGVAVAVAGNITISLALNCQKLAHMQLQDKDRPSEQEEEEEDSDDDDGPSTPSPKGKQKQGSQPQSSRSSISAGKHTQTDDEQDAGGMSQSNGTNTKFLKSKLWWLGIALMTIGELGNFISYGFAPASLVAPLGAVALLSNVIISPLMLHETFKAADIGGILLAIIGAVTVVFSSKESDARLGPDGLLHAIKRLEFVIYASIAAGLGGVLLFLSRTRFADRIVLIDVGACAIFGGFTVLSTKGISSLISGGQPLEALKYPITYVLALVLASTAVIQITYLNKALQRFDSRQVIPTQFVLFTISAIVGSAVLYRDFENTEVHRVINFLFGCMTTFAGVFVLTRRKEGGTNDEEEDGENTSLLSEGRQTRGRRRRPMPVAAMTTGSVPLASDARKIASPARSYTQEALLSRSAGASAPGLLTPRLSLSAGHYLLLTSTPPPLSLNARLSSSYGSTDLPFPATTEAPRRRTNSRVP